MGESTLPPPPPQQIDIWKRHFVDTTVLNLLHALPLGRNQQLKSADV